jgi:hypothetical protein
MVLTALKLDITNRHSCPTHPLVTRLKGGWMLSTREKRREFLQKNYPSRLERFDRETEMRRGLAHVARSTTATDALHRGGVLKGAVASEALAEI